MRYKSVGIVFGNLLLFLLFGDFVGFFHHVAYLVFSVFDSLLKFGDAFAQTPRDFGQPSAEYQNRNDKNYYPFLPLRQSDKC